jgi:hypothetical protein
MTKNQKIKAGRLKIDRIGSKVQQVGIFAKKTANLRVSPIENLPF